MADIDQSVIDRIDARTAAIAEKMDQMFGVVFIGNGHPSILTRLSLLEATALLTVAQCADCQRQRQALKDTPAPNQMAMAMLDQQTEIKKAVLTDRQKTVGAIVAALSVIALEVVHLIQAGSVPVK